jgi:hypothetical protein
MLYRIHAANRETGDPVVWDAECGSVREAEQQAFKTGHLLDRVVALSSNSASVPKKAVAKTPPIGTTTEPGTARIRWPFTLRYIVYLSLAMGLLVGGGGVTAFCLIFGGRKSPPMTAVVSTPPVNDEHKTSPSDDTKLQAQLDALKASLAIANAKIAALARQPSDNAKNPNTRPATPIATTSPSQLAAPPPIATASPPTDATREDEVRKLLARLQAEDPMSWKPIGVFLDSKDFKKMDVDAGDGSDQITFKLSFHNNTVANKEVRAFTGELAFTDLFDRDIERSKITVSEFIEPGKDIEWDGGLNYNQFDANDQRLKNMDRIDLKVKLYVSQVLYTDGTKEQFDGVGGDGTK